MGLKTVYNKKKYKQFFKEKLQIFYNESITVQNRNETF